LRPTWLKPTAFLSLLLLLAAFFVLEFAYPRFAATDEIAFKSPGRSMSQGGPFAAPELEGFEDLHLNPPIERIYFIYPPLYSWLFGEWTRVTGFGWAACVGYDALISAALALAVFGVADTVAGILLGPTLLGTALALLSALLTLLFRQVGRPDELGMVLGFANAWWLLRLPAASSRRISFVSGVLAALMLCTSAGVFLAFMPVLAVLWLRRVKKPEIAPCAAAFGLGAALTALLCLMPFFLSYPNFYQQFLKHSQSVLRSSAWNRISYGVSLAWEVAPHRLFILLATVPTLCLGMVTLWRAGRIGETISLFVAPLVSFGFLMFLRPAHPYMWFLEPWFLLVAVVVIANLKRPGILRLVATGWMAVWLAVASIWPVKDYIVRIALPAEQRLTPNARKLGDLIPKGASVLTLQDWWALGSDRAVYDPSFSNIQNLDRIEYFVTNGNGAGKPGVWFRPSNPRYNAMVREHFEVISDTLPRAPIRVFGFKVTNSAYGFGSVVLRRVSAQAQ